jgi:transposase-like protein
MAIPVHVKIKHMVNAVIRNEGSVRKAAKAIGVSPTTLYRWGACHGLGQRSYKIGSYTLPDAAKLQKIEVLYASAKKNLNLPEVG